MKVFKFGGVSIQDAASMARVGDIIAEHLEDPPLLVVVSAMGKTTNALEEILKLRLQNATAWRDRLHEVHQNHQSIGEALLPPSSRREAVLQALAHIFGLARDLLSHETMPPRRYAYDQVVSCGELASSRLLAAYLEERGLQTLWQDIRPLLITNREWQRATPQLHPTRHRVQERLPDWRRHQVVVTQGFLGGTDEGHTTTLGREGSDYTAAILANILNVEQMTVWKDVPGVLNADPKKIRDAVLLPALSFEEAIEMTYAGARVLHPQTIQPLQEKGILLHVRSFLSPNQEGTWVGGTLDRVAQPIIIIKENQALVELTTRDLSFINERNLSRIFHEVAEAALEIHLMQTSAVTFSMVVDHKPERIAHLEKTLSQEFIYEEKTALRLITVRHATADMLERFRAEHAIWFEQTSDVTTKLLVLASEE